MSPADWAGIFVSIMTLTVGFAGAVRWLVIHYFAELKPNGGSSLNDKIKLEVIPLLKELKQDTKELRENQAVIGERVARLEGRADASELDK